MRKHAFHRHILALLIILAISILLGFLMDGTITLFENATHPMKYEEFVEKYAAEYDVPTPVIYAVIYSESHFDPAAVSHAGAIGLMQMMPTTYEWLCTKTGDFCEERLLYNPETNIRYGTYLLSILHDRYGNWETAYAAYNAGIARVDGWLEDPAYTDEYGNLTNIPFEETRTYVKRVQKAREIYERLCNDNKK